MDNQTTCPNCGYRIATEDALFCPGCGIRIGSANAPKTDAYGNCTITVRYPETPADIGGEFHHFAIAIDDERVYETAMPGDCYEYVVTPGRHTVIVRQFNKTMRTVDARVTLDLTVTGGESIVVQSAGHMLRMYCNTQRVQWVSEDIQTEYPGNLMYCPYCHEVVHTGRIRWAWFFVFLLFGPMPIYLLYCLFSSGRICESCKHRIYHHR